jgi:hypothetical protein
MNLDRTGLRLVAKHRRVTLDGRTGTVTKLNRGQCQVQWDGEAYSTPHYCNTLEVI